MVRALSLLMAGLAITCVSGHFDRPAWSAAVCQVKAAVLSFGAYDVLSPIPKDATAQFTVTCNNVRAPDVVPVQVQLSAGRSGNAAQRLMPGATTGSNLYYNLYLNPAMSTVFGDGTAGSGVLTNSVNKSNPWTVTIYGRIPPLQNLPVGSYTDSLTITILY